jgi:hypothetical protein
METPFWCPNEFFLLVYYMVVLDKTYIWIFVAVVIICCLYYFKSSIISGCEHLVNNTNASEWVTENLEYKKFKKSNTIMDFSSVGYMGGQKPPRIHGKLTLKPSGTTDDTQVIQDAIDKISKYELNTDGHRGAISLSPGTYYIKGVLKINASGIVLRGSNTDSDPTKFICTLQNYRTIIQVRNDKKKFTERYSTQVTDTYIPVGKNKIRVDDTSNFKVGDKVIIKKNITDAFIQSLNMDTLTRSGKAQTWLKSGTTLTENRHITSINASNKVITLDIGISDAIDFSMFTDVRLTSYNYDYLYNIGIENIVLSVDEIYTGEFLTNGETNGLTFCELSGVIDSWVVNCTVNEFTSGIDISKNSSRITIDKNNFTRTKRNDGGALAFDIYLGGSQVLISNGTSTGKRNISVGTLANASGPNVVYNYTQKGGVSLEPHMRWASGLLVENVKGGDISIRNRGNFGTGHGWSMVNGVIWNCSPSTLNIQSPPGYKNFAIGCKSDKLNRDLAVTGDNGEVESYNNFVSYSLFEIQKKNNTVVYTLGM